MCSSLLSEGVYFDEWCFAVYLGSMRKDTALIVLGIVTALVPFIGVPSSWKTVITVVFGLVTMLVALSLRHYLTRVSERLSQQSKNSKTAGDATYVESETRTTNHSSVGYEATIIKPRRSRRIKQAV